MHHDTTGLFSYTVAAEFDDPAVCEEWIAWLRDGHLADVFAGGALRAEVLRERGEDERPAKAEVRYHFPSAEDFARYEREHAPRLRAEGLEKFPPSRGIRYARRTAVIAHSASASSG